MKTQTYCNSLNGSDICNTEDELCVNCTGAVKSDKGFKNSSKRSDYYIIYMLEGEMRIWIDDSEMKISKGQMVTIKAQTPYRYIAEAGDTVNYLWIHFSGIRASSILLDYNLEYNKILNVGRNYAYVEYWKKMFYEFILNDKYFNEMSCSVLKEILVSFSRNKNVGNKKRISKSIFYIHEHFMQNLEIVDLAEKEGLSKTRFRVCFKEATGESPKEYIISRRIEAACEMLRQSEKTLEEIAQAVGYSDVYYFGRIFKKRMGVSPGKYKNGRSF